MVNDAEANNPITLELGKEPWSWNCICIVIQSGSRHEL